jgi:hypothetical protein
MVNHEDETDTDVVRMGDMKNAYKIFAVNPQDKKPLEICRCSWENNKIELRDT